jgi:integrase
VRRPSPRKIIATPQELAALLQHAPPWMRVLILLGAHAGLRISDALQTAPIHRDPEGNTITIEQKKTKQTCTLPLTDQLREMLDHAPDGDPRTPYHALYKGTTISSAGFTHAWQRLKKTAQVNRELWFHDLRRTLAVSLYEVSKDLRVTEHMLGHKSLASTMQYLEHRDAAKLRPYLQSLFTPKGPVQ